ncbi:SH3 domain-containing protein [Meridianimarinicoccus sp. RP-17]|uniref:SH3 domain-containing protein n=1 Tax=Meridianimarinicoccus zhengii TaxID=2056810 RepID=UPI0013A69255|nr:SH3 domain-containing protein [Phycocomes zhengii]
MKLLKILPILQALHRPFVRFSALLATLALLLATVETSAQNIRTERVSFSTGTSGTVIRGEIFGDEIIDYVLGARGGQRMVVDLAVDNPSAYFNVLPADNPAAIHIGNVAGNHFDDILPSSGDWVIRVYLMRSAARRDERTGFSLSVHIGGAGHSVQAADFADGDAGGPDYWQVTGVSGGDHLNVRSGPSTRQSVIARVVNGQVFRNLGCRGTGDDRWCHVESGNGLVSGWVAGRYLRESGAPSGPSPTVPASEFANGEAGGPDFWEVYDVPAGDYLNMRTGPSTKYSIVARVANGQSLRNLGCRREGQTRWCHVQTPDGAYDAWVSGRFLREGAGSAASGPGVFVPSGSSVSPDLYMRPTGEVEVSWSGGFTVLYNPAGNKLQAGSTCSGNQIALSDASVARFHR